MAETTKSNSEEGKQMSSLQSFDQNNIKVLFRDEDGYIHLTALCKQAGKEFKAYNRTDTAKAFLEELSKSVNIPTHLLIQSVTKGSNESRGTWGHPQIAINLGQWISPQYAVSVTEMIMDHHRGFKQPKQLETGEIETSSKLFQSTYPVYQLVYEDKNQALLATDKAVKRTTTVSMLELGDVTLVAKVQEALLIPKQIGERLGGLSSAKINKLLEEIGLQVNTSYVGKGGITKKRWELTEAGKEYAIYVDTGRKHSDGAPVRNIQWYESVVDLLKTLDKVASPELLV